MKNYKFKSLANFGHFDHHRDETSICPVCKQSVSNIGINKLAYTMDACKCRKQASYDHVVEQLWHKACLVKYLTENPTEQIDYRYLPDSKRNRS